MLNCFSSSRSITSAKRSVIKIEKILNKRFFHSKYITFSIGTMAQNDICVTDNSFKSTFYNGHCEHCDKSEKTMFKCSVCLIFRYCSKKCQDANWPTHKLNCKKTDPTDPRIKLSKLNFSTLSMLVSMEIKKHIKDLVVCCIDIISDTFFDFLEGKLFELEPKSTKVKFFKKYILDTLNEADIIVLPPVTNKNLYYIVCFYKGHTKLHSIPIKQMEQIIKTTKVAKQDILKNV